MIFVDFFFWGNYTKINDFFRIDTTIYIGLETYI